MKNCHGGDHPENGDGIQVIGPTTKDVLIERVSCIDCADDGFDIGQGASHITVRNCIAQGSRLSCGIKVGTYGESGPSTSNTVVGCTCTKNAGDGINYTGARAIDPVPNEWTVIRRNHCVGNGTNGILVDRGRAKIFRNTVDASGIFWPIRIRNDASIIEARANVYLGEKKGIKLEDGSIFQDER